MKKIIIFGFPHSGTTILKCIMGHIEDVHELIEERDIIANVSSKKYTLCKWPWTEDKFFTDEYKDYIKIFIVRNPIYVYSSLNDRWDDKNLNKRHYVEKYIDMITKFCYYRKNPIENLYTIRYEDMFEDNYKELRDLFDKIGLQYEDKIFDNKNYVNKISNGIGPKNCSDNPRSRIVLYRTWQINKEFVNNNNPAKLKLTEEQKNALINNDTILEIYPDMKSELEKK